jgi:REP element-mobilizing transposase RayT
VAPGSLGAIVRSFKAAATKRVHEELEWRVPLWQRNYFEAVVRDGEEFSNAVRYIEENPSRWEWDRENPERKPLGALPAH